MLYQRTRERWLAHLRAAVRELEALRPLIQGNGQRELDEGPTAVWDVYLRFDSLSHTPRSCNEWTVTWEADWTTRERILDHLTNASRRLDPLRKLIPDEDQRVLTEARWAVGEVRGGRQPFDPVSRSARSVR